MLPQVIGLEAVRVWRIAFAVVPSPVEGQEPRRLALELRAELHLMVVDCEVGQTAAKLEELLAGVSVALVLLDGVSHRLLRQAVLELEGGDRQAVDEQAQIQGKLALIPAVAELARHAEPVQPIEGQRLLVTPRRRAVEQVNLVRSVPYALAQHVDCPALGYPLLASGPGTCVALGCPGASPAIRQRWAG